jgi:hypothetical protein
VGPIVLSLAACFASHEPEGAAVQRDGLAPSWRIITAVDFNADGLSDVLWHDPNTNRMAVFLVWGTHLLEPGVPVLGPTYAKWAPLAGGDFNFDGTADVLWANLESNGAAAWLMRGTRVLERGLEIPPPKGEGWAPVYLGDFNGDGMNDVLWYNETKHRIAVSLMAGTCEIERGQEQIGPPGTDWTVPTCADYNRDGMMDILWFNTKTHDVAVWLMKGTELLEPGPLIPGLPENGWKVPTGADFNGDGMNDVIWNDPDRNLMAIWLMAGTNVLEKGQEIPGPPGDGWSVGSANDADGDGLADTYWQNVPRDTWAVWTMLGTRVHVRGCELPGPR